VRDLSDHVVDVEDGIRERSEMLRGEHGTAVDPGAWIRMLDRGGRATRSDEEPDRKERKSLQKGPASPYGQLPAPDGGGVIMM
jgi:hypothetical protein